MNLSAETEQNYKKQLKEQKKKIMKIKIKNMKEISIFMYLKNCK